MYPHAELFWDRSAVEKRTEINLSKVVDQESFNEFYVHVSSFPYFYGSIEYTYVDGKVFSEWNPGGNKMLKYYYNSRNIPLTVATFGMSKEEEEVLRHIDSNIEALGGWD